MTDKETDRQLYRERNRQKLDRYKNRKIDRI